MSTPTRSSSLPLPERTRYGLRATLAGRPAPTDVREWARRLQARLREAGPAPGAVVIDARTLGPCDAATCDALAVAWRAFAACGVSRSAVVVQDVRVLAQLRQAARSAGWYDRERYFQATGTAWEHAALAWVAEGREPTVARADEVRADVALLLDAMDEGVAVHDGRGARLHANAALAAHLEDDAVRRAIDALVRELLPGAAWAATTGAWEASAPLVREHATAGVPLRLQARVVAPGLFTPGPAVLVTVARCLPLPPSDAELRGRFRLGVRQLAVARLAARGLSNAEIGRALGIRAGTARNQLSAVMLKLGVSNRTQLGAVLAGQLAAGPPAPVVGRAA